MLDIQASGKASIGVCGMYQFHEKMKYDIVDKIKPESLLDQNMKKESKDLQLLLRNCH